MNGLLVDNRPIKVCGYPTATYRYTTNTKKIEIVVTGDKAAAIVPTAKSLTDRVSQPKAQPKSAANNKKKDAAGKAGGSDTRPARGRAQKKNARPAKKTADELDSEMADYFVANGQSNDNATAAAPAAVSGDAAMADEIL